MRDTAPFFHICDRSRIKSNKSEVFEIKSNSRILIKGAAAMTVFSLVAKLLGVFLRLFLSARIGSEGMGLYQLIMSVYVMFSTFATGGFTLSVSRLVAEKDQRSQSDAMLLMKNAFLSSALISAVATAVMLFSADFIAQALLNDIRCAQPLRILAFSMPFMAFSACLKGWFIAKLRLGIRSSSTLFEQIVKIAVIMLFLNALAGSTNDVAELCVGIVIGVTLSEVASFLYLWLFYIFPRRISVSSFAPTESRRDNLRSLTAVNLPISLSVYLTSVLHTAETLLIPYVFESYSGDRSKALSQFGMIRGMVIPILFFPFAFLSSIVAVFTPEISRLNLLPDRKPLNTRVASLMSFVSIFSVAVGGLFFFLPYELGEAFYPNESTECAIRILALVTPFMYVETVCDGLLKAIGEQVQTLKYQLWNFALRVVLIILLVSHTGEKGYLILLVASNTLTYILCRRRLFKATGVAPRIVADIIFPTVCATVGGICARLTVDKLGIASKTAAASAGTAVYIGIFALCLMLFAFERIKSTYRRLRG